MITIASCLMHRKNLVTKSQLRRSMKQGYFFEWLQRNQREENSSNAETLDSGHAFIITTPRSEANTASEGSSSSDCVDSLNES